MNAETTADIRSIALSGSAGTGKTTLGKVLAAQFDVPFIEEGMRARLESGLDLHRLNFDELKALLRELFDELTEAADRAGHEHGGFVTDRSPVDFAAFWLYYRFAEDVDETGAFMARVEHVLPTFKRIFVLPWGVIPLVDDGVRSANPYLQLHYQALLDGLYHGRDNHEAVAFVPKDVLKVEARVRWIFAQCVNDSPV